MVVLLHWTIDSKGFCAFIGSAEDSITSATETERAQENLLGRSLRANFAPAPIIYQGPVVRKSPG